MTVMPRGPGPAQLICDGCGVAVTVTGMLLHDDELAWPIIADQGWNGSPFATGPHRCPSCIAKPDEAGPEQRLAQRRDLTATGSTPPSWRRVRLCDGSEVVVFRPAEDLVAPVADVVDRALTEVLPLGRHLVLDLAAVKVIEPPGLASLVRAHQAIKRKGGLVCLAAPSRFVVTVLHTMRLDRVFPRFDDEARALAWLDTQTDGAADARTAGHRESASATPRRRSTAPSARVWPAGGRDYQVVGLG